MSNSLVTIAVTPRASLQNDHLHIGTWTIRSRNDVIPPRSLRKHLAQDCKNRDRARVSLAFVNLIRHSHMIVLQLKHLFDAIDYNW